MISFLGIIETTRRNQRCGCGQWRNDRKRMFVANPIAIRKHRLVWTVVIFVRESHRYELFSENFIFLIANLFAERFDGEHFGKDLPRCLRCHLCDRDQERNGFRMMPCGHHICVQCKEKVMAQLAPRRMGLRNRDERLSAGQ